MGTCCPRLHCGPSCSSGSSQLICPLLQHSPAAALWRIVVAAVSGACSQQQVSRRDLLGPARVGKSSPAPAAADEIRSHAHIVQFNDDGGRRFMQSSPVGFCILHQFLPALSPLAGHLYSLAQTSIAASQPVMAWASTVYGLTLCAVAGVSGAGAAVFGKLAGAQGIDSATQITCYALLIVVSATWGLQGDGSSIAAGSACQAACLHLPGGQVPLECLAHRTSSPVLQSSCGAAKCRSARAS